MTSITVDKVTGDGSTLRCEVSYSKDLRRFFTGKEFVVRYDVAIEGVPDSVLAIPVLAHVCPVAWANGADVRAPAVDSTFLDALRDVSRSLAKMYPEFMEASTVHVEEAVSNDVEDRDAGSSAMLFSGGVDSMATYIRHAEVSPDLISVQGWVIEPDQPDRWARVQDRIEAFAETRDVETQFVWSNMLEFLDSAMLEAHYQRFVDGAWYSSVGHGLGLLGLCAPLAYVQGYDAVYMASTHTEDYGGSWGSHPEIDDRVRWSGTACAHDGYELSRQEKIELIADYVRDGNHDVTLRTCIHSEVGGNCNQCEKCYRTIAGLTLAGLDPNEFGYEVDAATFRKMRKALVDGAFVLGRDEVFMWRDIQSHVDGEGPAPVADADSFFDWLRTVDVEALADRSKQPLHRRAIQAGMRHLPYPVWAVTYPAYKQLVGS